jgi:hypothetical protein
MVQMMKWVEQNVEKMNLKWEASILARTKWETGQLEQTKWETEIVQERSPM